MSVFQIEEYYICIVFDKPLSAEIVEKIEGLLCEEGLSDYRLDKDSLSVESIDCECAAENLDMRIMELVE